MTNVLPYELPLEAGISPGLLITVVGVPAVGGERFHINFMKGSNVTFHINPRFSEQSVVRNSCLEEGWGEEERDGMFPFVEGQGFELQILVQDDVYKVTVDGTYLHEFRHRDSGFQDITMVHVDGDVVIESVTSSTI